MPTPYGSRGGMAFSADELRVVRDALSLACQSSWFPAPPAQRGAAVQGCLELSAALEEATHEADRMQIFLHADLARYRAALPGSAAGYTELLGQALAGGYAPRAGDIDALRTLCALPAGPATAERRRTLLARCERLATTHPGHPAARIPGPQRPARRAVLRAVPGGRSGAEPEKEPAREPEPESEPEQQPQPRPQAPARQPAAPGRPVPTPAEVFPPRRRPSPPPEQLLPTAARTA